MPRQSPHQRSMPYRRTPPSPPVRWNGRILQYPVSQSLNNKPRDYRQYWQRQQKRQRSELYTVSYQHQPLLRPLPIRERHVSARPIGEWIRFKRCPDTEDKQRTDTTQYQLHLFSQIGQTFNIHTVRTTGPCWSSVFRMTMD